MHIGKVLSGAAAARQNIVTVHGAAIFCREDNKIEQKLLRDGKAYDAANFAVVNTIVRPGSVCFDIGANIGVYSAVMSRIAGFDGMVHAFEPVNHIRRRLHVNRSLNGGRNIVVNDFALGDEHAEMEMFQVKEGQFRGGTSTFVRNNNVQAMGDDAFERKTVRIVTLDSYAADQSVQRADFLKIDVEGFEINVLRGASRLLADHKPAVLFEHDQKRLAGLGVKDDDFRRLFDAAGYAVFEPLLVSGGLALLPFAFDRAMESNNLVALHLGR